MSVREERKKQKEKLKNDALQALPQAIFALGCAIDHLEEKTKEAGLKIHAETWKALHRHQQNIGLVIHRSRSEVN